MGRRPRALEGVVNPSPEFWSGRRVLLTGHTGFKGAWLSAWLERLDAEAHAIALPSVTTPDLFGGLRLSGRYGVQDIRDAAGVRAAFDAAQPEIILHLAAQALVHDSYREPVETFATNVMGTINVFEAARATPSVRAIVNVTSDKAYENVEQIWAYRETDRMGGSDPYSASKGCAELVANSWRRSFFSKEGRIALGSARAGNVIGGGDWSADRLIPDCVRAFEAGQPVPIRNPLATRPWQHVLEPLSGYLRLAEALIETPTEAAEGWNFGPADEDAAPVELVVNRVVDLWGDGAAWRLDDNSFPKEAMLLRVDATKARVRLGWRPRLSLDDALSWTVDWYKAAAGGADVHDLTLQQIEAYEARGGPHA